MARSLFCIVTSRGTYPVLDLARAIKWSCQESQYVVVIDRKGDVQLPENLPDQAVLKVSGSGDMADGFLAGLGVKWAIDQGMEADQYVLLSDECMVLQRGLDTWALGVLTRTQVGLVGVLDRNDYRDAYRRCAPIMDHWGMPHSSYTPDGFTLVSPALFVSRQAGRLLFDRGLLTPEGPRWPLSYGAFLSWAVQMHGLYQVGWGHTDKQMPPLFVYCEEQVRCQPAPHILSSRFLLYYSARQVPGYAEEQLRETYKRMRGEPAQTIEPVRPLVSPQQQGPTVLG